MQEKRLLMRLQGRVSDKMPVWLMRQAGRYLPEYHEIRKKSENFVSFCLNPILACEATLQPIKRFDMDGAIIFADILLVPYALGRRLSFESKEGPKIERVSNEKDLGALFWDIDTVAPVFETIRRVKQALPKDKTLIGFAGGLWTVACYMIEGQGKQGFSRVLKSVQQDDPFLSLLFEELESATIDYLVQQIKSGAEVIQIFESHAGLLQGADFDRWVIEPTKRIVAALKAKHPEVPVIGFPRGALLEDYTLFSRETGVDALNLDPLIDRQKAKESFGPLILQGNMAPEILVTGGEKMDKEIDSIKKDWGEKHIFNLGHGVLPQTPIKNVAALVARIRI